MAIDPRFYRLARRVSAGELAGVLEAGLRGRAEAVIADFSQPQHSDETMLSGFAPSHDNAILMSLFLSDGCPHHQLSNSASPASR